MNKQYDFSNATKNPYFKKLKKQITIRLDHETISYFKGLANEYGMPYQNLINLYLSECAHSHKKLLFKWAA
ncbi:MAG: BrnA antitoxin family protein [Elusimicrobia bacterium]|nr:BrnA antitoxin family protein [Candidatus Liberimonas magnetica]